MGHDNYLLLSFSVLIRWFSYWLDVHRVCSTQVSFQGSQGLGFTIQVVLLEGEQNFQQKIWREAPSPAWRGTMILPESAAPEQVEVDQSHMCGRATSNIHIRNNSQEKTESTKICRVFNTVNTCFDCEPNAASAWGEQLLPWKLICLFWVQKMRLICLMLQSVFRLLRSYRKCCLREKETLKKPH